MIPTIQLNNGQKMPQEGFGTFQITDFETCKNAVLKALDMGYRLIDTAQVYKNEQAVGAALKLTSVPRSEIFVTTKVWLPFFGDDVTEKSVEDSLQRLGLDYLDLVLLHEPYGDYYGAYRDLEKLVVAGKIRSIGVSNFDAGQLMDLTHQMQITPAVNQVELNLYQQQDDLRKYQTEKQIIIEAWAPLGEVNGSILQEPSVVQIAEKYHKTTAQILLHYLVQLGAVIIPKSVQESHMRDNLDIWNFDLSLSEMQQLAILNKNKWLSPNRHTLGSTKHYMDLIDEGLDN
ncbi:aldo/keto reductase [Companilactobacillus huachuanensis]|uniref:Aldo/keto reductase n=1 Tax=Companilactobacillus huachuanensis TaxID=2559914 RepID=A0ABW1RLP1_9LACO|nr:aldo/keto reductase [Companilactobacillus huachuanensis]